MTSRRGTALACSSAAAAALALASCGGSRTVAAEAPAPRERPRGVVENCSTRSEASFPGAFSNPGNVVVGPLALMGAGYTAPEIVREYGGNKFPALVRAGHRVTVELSRATRRVAGLGYGPLPEGVELTPRDGHRVVTFIACGRGERSGSRADGEPVTFWSGFVLTRSPRCVPIRVWVDGERAPRHTTLRMGVRRCP